MAAKTYLTTMNLFCWDIKFVLLGRGVPYYKFVLSY